MARQKKDVDWNALEIDYRANIKTMRALASEYGISTARIGQMAIEMSWERDLTAKIAAKAQAKVDRSILDAILDKENTVQKKIIEADVVNANANARADVQIRHRADIARFRGLSLKLLDELESQTDNHDLYAELGELLRQEGDNGQDRRNDLYNKVIDLPSRIDGSKKLAETLKHLIGLEREAYGINDAQKIEVTTTDKRSVSSEDAAQAYMALIG